jgi:hypothetical protein
MFFALRISIDLAGTIHRIAGFQTSMVSVQIRPRGTAFADFMGKQAAIVCVYLLSQ